MKKIVGSTPKLLAKVFISFDRYQLKIWIESSVFAIQHKENRKRFTEVLPPMTELILLHTVVVLHRTHHITSSPMGNDCSPWSQHNVWRHHNSRCSKADNSELETVTRINSKHRYDASSSYLQVLKRSELKLH